MVSPVVCWARSHARVSLSQVAGVLSGAGGGSRRRQRRQQQGRQQADDDHHHQQFNQRETFSFSLHDRKSSRAGMFCSAPTSPSHDREAPSRGILHTTTPANGVWLSQWRTRRDLHPIFVSRQSSMNVAPSHLLSEPPRVQQAQTEPEPRRRRSPKAIPSRTAGQTRNVARRRRTTGS